MEIPCDYNGPMAAKKKTKVDRKEESMRIRVTGDEKDLWTVAAKKDGRDLSGWLRHLANQAVKS
jgi:uncharacterized protein (DUF1778 family)